MRLLILTTLLIISLGFIGFMYSHKVEFYRLFSHIDSSFNQTLEQASETEDFLSNEEQRKSNLAYFYSLLRPEFMGQETTENLDLYLAEKWPVLIANFLYYILEEPVYYDHIINVLRILPQDLPEANEIRSFVQYEGNGVKINHLRAYLYASKCSASKQNCQRNRRISVDRIIANAIIQLKDRDQFNNDEALQNITFLAEKEEPKALYLLGLFHTKGIAVEKDLPKAFNYLLDAATLGDKRSQIIVSQMYLIGLGTKQDRIEAYKWAMKAN